jgi:phosphoglycerate dehydrogenase-like enzyme
MLYPTRGADAFDVELSRLRALDPRLDVEVCYYEVPRDLRILRAEMDADAYREQAPELTTAQRDIFRRAEIVMTHDLPADLPTVAPNLRWVQGIGAGTEHLEAAGLTAAGIRLTSGAGTSAGGIAEFVIGRVLAEWKRFRELDEWQRAHVWDRQFGDQLAGTTAGLLGLGAINSAVAARLQAFGVRVIACRRTPGAADVAGVDQVYPPAELEVMLAQSDIVIAAAADNDQTRGLMNADRFASMKPGAFFVNVGRGSLVDEPALIAALRSGQLRGAALDVTVNEPIPADDPLWDAPNIYLSPHAATVPAALFVNLHRLFRENVTRYLAGEKLLNEVGAFRD